MPEMVAKNFKLGIVCSSWRFDIEVATSNLVVLSMPEMIC